MEDSRVLRSGKKTPVSDLTPPSGETGSSETNTWSKGTGTSEEHGSAVASPNLEIESQQRLDEPNRNNSAPSTVVEVSGDRASSRLSLLKAEIEVRESELAQARAASAAARSRFELAKAELALSSDAAAPPLLVDESKVQVWVSEQDRLDRTSGNDRAHVPGKGAHCKSAKQNPRVGTDLDDRFNDMSNLAEAIVHAVNSRPNSSIPKFIHELPHFDGTSSEWIPFKSVFVDTESSFSDVQNVARLRKALRGAARDLVRTLLYTSQDPIEILEALERRYGRPDILILTELENIKRMPRLNEDGRNIASFASKVANTVAAIKALDKPQYLYAPDLANKIADKLNLIMRYKWCAYKTSHKGDPELVTISKFLNKMSDECCTMYTYDSIKEDRKARPKPRVNTSRVSSKQTRARSYSCSSSCSEPESDIETPPRKTVATVKKSSKRNAPKQREPEPRPSPPPANKKSKCAICAGGHGVQECADFKKLDPKERWDAAKKYKLCFRCLGDSHKFRVKCKYIPCGIGGCEAAHNKLLHSTAEVDKQPSAHGSVSSISQEKQANTYLKIVPVEVSGPLGTIATLALLDDGSSMTLIERKIADEIAPRGRGQLLSLEGVGGNKLDDSESCRVKLSIRGMCSRNLESMDAYTIQKLSLSPQQVDRELVMSCEHLASIEDELCYERGKPTILIGQDNWHLITTRQLRVGRKNEPVASLTKLGWVLHGKNFQSNVNTAIINHVRTREIEDPALAMIRNFFSIESLGIEPRKPTTDPEQRALAVLDKTCKKIDNRDQFEAGLLWRSDNETMPDNRKQAFSRLRNLESKLDKDESLKLEYTRQMDNLINSGYAEKVHSPPDSPRAWYLPHFSVTHPQKGKVRLVFDAAAKTEGKCLNDALLAGPDLLQSLYGVLIRFREGKIAVVADIKEMFLQVKIIEQDRDSLRFLWRGRDRVGPPQEYRMSSLIFGAASSPCTAIYVKNKNAESHAQEYPEVARATVRNFYMDDYLGVFQDEETAKRTVNAMYKVHKAASFELRGWASNEPSVIEQVTDTRNTDTTTLGKSDSERTLGLIWNHKRDTLGFNVNLRNTPANVLSGSVAPTKRQVTSAVMSVFDPLGLVSPVTMVGKALIQEVWRSGVGWDDVITSDNTRTWTAFIKNLELLRDLEIERCVFSSPEGGELHTFCDASEKVYAAAVYFVSTTSDGKKVSKLVAGKAKVAPLRPISVPRLELQAAVLGSRLAESVKRETEYKINKCHFWSDSKTVLAWIKSDPRTYKSFVAHRLAEIESLTTPVDWRWVPSAENVADDATKGIPANFNAQHRWFVGPRFIRGDPETWPKEKPVSAPPPPSGEERDIKPVLALSRRDRDCLPQVDRFSQYTRLLRATATMLLAAEVFKATLLKGKIRKSVENEHLQIAEALLIRRSQRAAFGEEISHLEAGRRIPKKFALSKLAVTLKKNGIIYLDGRTKENHAFPVLHAKDDFTRLLIHHTHVSFNHGNHNTVMNELQKKFFIVGLRGSLRYICNKCQWCRTYKGRPSKIPVGDLPIERLAYSQPPFTATAVDYFGPMHVTVGRRHEKRWGALYTCLTTRAVHVELAPSLTASSMILTLRRMMARRGAPTVIYSDNGTNFVGAEKEIAEAVNENLEELQTYALNKQIMWKKIPPGAPAMGGAWERLVGLIKAALRVTLKEKFPSDEILHTLITEAEHVVNSRPLTPVNPNMNEEALTPNHFLIGRSSGMIPFGSFKDSEMTTKTWKSTQALADAFWKRWLTEYKPLLMPRRGPTIPHTNIKVGDIVIIADSTMPRGIWPRGEVMKVHPGPDGRVRVAEVRTTMGLIRRPASRLVVITS